MDIDYKLVFSNRKTVSLVIKRDGYLTVRAPNRISKKEIEKILNEKQGWIKKHLSKINITKTPKHEYAEGELFWFQGQKYPLRVTDEYRSKIIFANDVFYISRLKIPQGKKMFTDWYAKQAAEIIFQRTKHYAEQMNVKYKRISITSAQTRWGSCSSGQTINFTWRLVLAPLEIIDSVIVHELAHLTHHNHSKSFWTEVKTHYPDYSKAKKWLKENGHLLQI